MKGLRSFLALLVVAVALGGYVYHESKQELGGPEKKLEKVFPDVQSDKLEQVTVKSAGGDRTTLQKQGSGWQMTQPSPLAAGEGGGAGIRPKPAPPQSA